jgi:hypothetical protein
MRMRALLAVLVTAISLAGCYGDSSENAASTASPAAAVSTMKYPEGILSDATAAAAMVGVFPTTPDDVNCCWVSKSVRFRVFADAQARALLLYIYVPGFDPWKSNPGAVSFVTPAGKVLGEQSLKPGFQTLVFHIPKGTEPVGTDVINLKFTDGYVPQDYHLNGDSRLISAMLQKVSLQY